MTKEFDQQTQTELEAAAFRTLVEHLRERTDVQNIDLMNLAGFAGTAYQSGTRRRQTAKVWSLIMKRRGKSCTECRMAIGNPSIRRTHHLSK